MQTARFITVLTIAISLSACDTKPAEQTALDDTVEAAASDGETADAEETVSILRPDIEQPDMPDAPLEPLAAVVSFPEGGDELDPAALDTLEEVLASDQLQQGGAILLGGHSDAGGSDDANARASEARAMAVARWLIDKGVDADRIDVIVFGEQNPAEPNAMPDGSPNEEGRAANRRVEIIVTPPAVPAESSS